MIRPTLLVCLLAVAGTACSVSDEGLTVGSWPHHATGSDDIFASDKIPICRERALAVEVPRRQASFDECMRSFGF